MRISIPGGDCKLLDMFHMRRGKKVLELVPDDGLKLGDSNVFEKQRRDQAVQVLRGQA